MKLAVVLVPVLWVGCSLSVPKPTSDRAATGAADSSQPSESEKAEPIATGPASDPESVEPASSPGDNREPDSDSEKPGSSAELSFEIDPDSLSFPVVFHLGDSETWRDEAALRPILAEVQRILAQANIEIIPQYTEDAAATAFLDVTYVPSVPNNPGVNGISFGGADLEVFVKDAVGLGKVADARPSEVPAVRTVQDAKPGETIAVDAKAAMQGRTTAHEICHQLGLPHRQNSTNLMASGTTGWTLNEAEVVIIRKTAVNKFKAKFVPNLDLAVGVPER